MSTAAGIPTETNTEQLERRLNLKLREVCDSIKKVVATRSAWMDISYISNIYDKEVREIIRSFTQQAYALGTADAAHKIQKEPYVTQSDLDTIKAMAQTALERFWDRIDKGIMQQQYYNQDGTTAMPYSNDWLVDSLASDIIFKAYNLAVKLKAQKLVD